MRDAFAEFRRIFVQLHTVSVSVFFFSGGVYSPLRLSLMISMCQREAMFKKLGSAFSFLDFDISCDMPAWSCTASLHVVSYSSST